MTDWLIFGLFGLLLLGFGSWPLIAELRDEVRDRNYALETHANDQHRAILAGDYVTGSYGRYLPPPEFRYLSVPDWTPTQVKGV